MLLSPLLASGNIQTINTDNGTSYTAGYDGQPKADSAYIPEYIGNEEEFRQHLDLVEKFYQDRDYALAWFKNDKLVPQADKLIHEIEKAYQQGLKPQDYKVKNIREMYRDFEARSPSDAGRQRKQQEIDLALTASYTLIMHQIFTKEKLLPIVPQLLRGR